MCIKESAYNAATGAEAPYIERWRTGADGRRASLTPDPGDDVPGNRLRSCTSRQGTTESSEGSRKNGFAAVPGGDLYYQRCAVQRTHRQRADHRL